jgi:hypothetical protein
MELWQLTIASDGRQALFPSEEAWRAAVRVPFGPGTSGRTGPGAPDVVGLRAKSALRVSDRGPPVRTGRTAARGRPAL